MTGPTSICSKPSRICTRRASRDVGWRYTVLKPCRTCWRQRTTRPRVWRESSGYWGKCSKLLAGHRHEVAKLTLQPERDVLVLDECLEGGRSPFSFLSRHIEGLVKGADGPFEIRRSNWDAVLGQLLKRPGKLRENQDAVLFIDQWPLLRHEVHPVDDRVYQEYVVQ